MQPERAPHDHNDGSLVDLLSNQTRRVDGSQILVVVAHPAEDVVGCGAQLARWVGVRVLVVTNGAPVDGREARRQGFASVAEYATWRQNECRQALALAGVAPAHIGFLGVPDQAAASRMSGVKDAIAQAIAHTPTRYLVTHAYEGGHPDHDAVALAAHLAVEAASQPPPTLIEMPYFHASGIAGFWRRQAFCGQGPEPVEIVLGEQQIELKRAMVACHDTQSETLVDFDLTTERFRAAPRYDFTQPPNNGEALYSQQNWGITPEDWRMAATEALNEAEQDLR
jgi:LmbE family N-acetylglucosaminyl deacetylase